MFNSQREADPLLFQALVGIQWLLGACPPLLPPFQNVTSWTGTGPGTSNHFEAGGFICSSDDRPYPNVMFHFLPLSIRYDGSGGNTRCAFVAVARWSKFTSCV
jgi:hypothetical protein